MVNCMLPTLLIVTLICISDGVGRYNCPLTRLPVDASDGFITFPAHYNKSISDCRWILEASRDEWSIKIQVLWSNLKFGIYEDCQSSDNYVELLEMPDERRYGLFCGDEKRVFYSTTKRVMIKLRNRIALTGNQGFKLKYSAGMFGSIGDEIIRTQEYTVQEEPLVFSEPYLSSSEYPQFVQRAWRISSDDQEQDIYVQALSLSLPKGCVFEYIEVFNGKDRKSPSLGKWCGTDTPDKIVATGTIYIVLNVRNFVEDTAFQIEYGIEVKSEIPMIAGIFVGVILFIGVSYVLGRIICSKYMNDDDSDVESEAGQTPANHTLLSDVSTRDDPPRFSDLLPPTQPFSELPPPVPSAPPVDAHLHPPDDLPSAPPPSYEDFIKSPLSYNETSTH